VVPPERPWERRGVNHKSSEGEGLFKEGGASAEAQSRFLGS